MIIACPLQVCLLGNHERIKGHSSRPLQKEFPHLGEALLEAAFLARVCFSMPGGDGRTDSRIYQVSLLEAAG